MAKNDYHKIASEIIEEDGKELDRQQIEEFDEESLPYSASEDIFDFVDSKTNKSVADSLGIQITPKIEQNIRQELDSAQQKIENALPDEYMEELSIEEYNDMVAQEMQPHINQILQKYKQGSKQ